MKIKTTLIIFAVFAVLLAFVLIFENIGKGKKEEEEKLVDLSSDDVHKIRLKKEDETLIFEKNEAGEWLITEPLEAKADKYEVDRLADDFSDLPIQRVVEEEPEDLEKYKIPQKEITLWYKGQEEPVKLLIGMENPLDNHFFARREGEKRIVLLSSYLKSMMEKSLFDFRQKNVFRFEADEVKNIKLKAKDVEWVAEKIEEEWFFRKPFEALAVESQISGILSSLSNLKAKEFVSEDKQADEAKEYGLDKPEYEITLNMPSSNQQVTFALAKKEEDLYATTSLSSKIITAEDTILSDLEKEAAELREKEVTNFNSWEVNKLHLKMGGIDWVLVKDEEDNWRFESPVTEEADKSKIETFIRKIEGLEAEEFIDPPHSLELKDYGLDTPQAEVELWVKEDEDKVKEIKVLIGTEDKEAKKVVVKNARLDYLFKMDSSFLEEFPKEIKDWQPEKEEENP